MKKSLFLSTVLGAFVIVSCNQNPKNTEHNHAAEDHSHHDECYLAVSGEDTVSMYYHNHGGKIQGTIDFKFKEKQSTNGDIRGEFKGDTLFVDYTFNVNNTPSRNPLVFLKKDGKLLQGFGDIETYLGKTYFKKDAPITFGEGFNFDRVDCH